MRLLALLVIALLAPSADAQVADSTHRFPGAVISGVIRDSISNTLLSDAVVQLVAAGNPGSFARSVVSDTLGRFSLTDVPDGRYMLGFFHPMLDSLGVEAPLREVNVSGNKLVHIDLAIPSPARLRSAICRQSSRDSSAVVIGVVRDAKDAAPTAGVMVRAEWLELQLDLKAHEILRKLQRVTATTADNGWFSLCGVPNVGTLALLATRGADSTDLIEMQIPPDGFLRRDLYIGSARTVAASVAAAPSDSIASPRRRVRLGDGRLSGTVVSAADNKPLAGAQVSISEGPETKSNERGEWTLVDAPGGTRTLEVRALGFYPARRRVDIFAGAPPVKVTLSTFKAVLDTVKIYASRLRNDNLGDGFQQRRRMGFGRFITPADIAKFPVVVTSDLFRMVPGVRYAVDGFRKSLQLRGMFEPWCDPAIFINGHEMSFMDTQDIDDWVHPNEVAGIEVYAGTVVPPQFQVGLKGCGSIVIWTK